MKKLYRSENNKVISGILGGLGEYLEIDPVVIRIVYLILTCFTAFFPGVVFYIVAHFIVPKKPHAIYAEATSTKAPSQEEEKTDSFV